MSYFKINGERVIADNTEIVPCPCCKAELLVGFSEWLNFVAEKDKVEDLGD